MIPDKGYAIVVDLNKCVGCQACAIACKVWWTSKEKGLEHAWWIVTETRPGRGYPKNWVEKVKKGIPNTREDYEADFRYRYENLLSNPSNGVPRIYPEPLPKYGPNWEWDLGVGETQRTLGSSTCRYSACTARMHHALKSAQLKHCIGETTA